MAFTSSTGLWNVSDYGSTPLFNSANANNLYLSQKDKDILRGLAFKVAILSNRKSEVEKRYLWSSHNSLKSVRPVIFCDPENGWNEIITGDLIECEGRVARNWELVLRKEIFWGESVEDDKVIEPFFDVGYVYSESNWGLDIKMHKISDRGSYVWDAPIKNFDDINRISFPTLEIDLKKTKEIFEMANDIFGDILKVRIKGKWWWSLGLTNSLALLRGLENIMTDMIENPKLIHQLMQILKTGTMKRLDYLEENDLLSLNNDSYVGSGGFGYTQEIPKKGFDANKVRTIDMWGFCESQETAYISPEMFKEFIYFYQLPILSRFGLNCYGCCEALEKRWDIIKNTPNLRRVSVSPWADLMKMADFLEDKYICSIKPNPADLVFPSLDKDNIRKKIRRVLDITKGCVVEIIMKDNHTIGGNPSNIVDWVKICKEEIGC